MEIYLCRHGQTTGDVEDRFGGDYDDHLTDLGKSQAVELANKLKGKGIEKIFSSSKIRAIETSKEIAKVLGCETEIVPDLRERNQNGILTGLIRSEAKEKYPEMVEEVKNYLNTIEGAENYEDFSKRVQRALSNIASRKQKIVAIVTHGGPIRVILREIQHHLDYKIDDCAFAILETKNDEIKVTSLNGIEPKE